MDMFKEYGVFKCLGCNHYLSGDYFDCKKDCPRTENGTEQIQCRIQHIDFELQELERKKTYLCKQKNELTKILTVAPIQTTEEKK